MSDWRPPDAPPPPPPPAPPYQAWPPYPTAPQPPASTDLPWWRTTPAIVLGALLCLLVGGIGGIIVAVAGNQVLDAADDDVTAADVRTYGSGGDLAAFELGPGQCAVEGIDERSTLREGDLVDCGTEHAVEVFGRVDAPDIGRTGSDVDPDDLASFGDHACFLAFESYVGTTYDDSEYDYLAVVPSETTWDGGGRTVHCVLFPYDTDTTTGSAAGSGR